LDCGVHLRAGCDRTRTTGPGGEPLSSATDSERHAFRENTHFARSSGPRGRCRIAENVNQLILSTFSRTVVNSAHLLHRLANRPSIDEGASNFASNVLINKLCKSLSSDGPTSSRIERGLSFKAPPSEQQISFRLRDPRGGPSTGELSCGSSIKHCISFVLTHA
jgi:hypothetical protein